MQAQSRAQWYRAALQSLGPIHLLRLQLSKLGRFAGRGTMCLSSPDLSHAVHARHGTSDLSVFDQIFVEREYRDINHLSDGLIVDCGANVGYSSAWFLSRFPNCFVVAIEPDPDNFAILEKNLSAYPGRCRAYRAAVWPNDAEAVSLSASTAEVGHEWGRRVERGISSGRVVPTISIPRIMRENGYTKISLLKVDIEGAEVELFNDEAGDWLQAVENIVIELHGDAASEVFFSRIGDEYDISRSGELTLALKRRRIT